jgi:hypothetical protein
VNHDHRDLVITELANSEAELMEHVIVYREIVRAAIHRLHETEKAQRVLKRENAHLRAQLRELFDIDRKISGARARQKERATT